MILVGLAAGVASLGAGPWITHAVIAVFHFAQSHLAQYHDKQTTFLQLKSLLPHQDFKTNAEAIVRHSMELMAIPVGIAMSFEIRFTLKKKLARMLVQATELSA